MTFLLERKSLLCISFLDLSSDITILAILTLLSVLSNNMYMLRNVPNQEPVKMQNKLKTENSRFGIL